MERKLFVCVYYMDLITTNVNKMPFVFLIFTSVLLVVINEKKNLKSCEYVFKQNSCI
uniref:Uncharacterized protein n=1 Tax=viral metagenome TaxID=1070528 RepID=A0A6C0JBW9_9ZZZZ